MSKPNEYITDLLHKLREDISQIKHRLFTEKPKPQSSETPPHYAINAVHKDGKPSEEDNNAIRATLKLPETIRIDAKTEEHHKQWHKDRTVWLQLIGIGVGIAVAVIYLYQLITMQHQLKFEKERFVTEQRPYIWFVSDKPVIKVGSQMSWNVIAENDGRSTALRMHTCVGMLVRIAHEPLPLDERFKKDIPAPSFSKCPVRATDENRGLSPPGGKTVLTAFGGVLTQENVDYVNSVFGNLVIEAISEYEDGRGNHYLTTFCDIYSPVGLNAQCPYYNDVK
jgi:hypothetical protein